MRLLVYNTEGKIFGKLSTLVETQSTGPQYPLVNNSPNKHFNCCSAHRIRKTDNYVHLKR